MQKKFMAVPVSLVVAAFLVSAPTLAQMDYHVTTGFDSKQPVKAGEGEGCVRSGESLTDKGFSCSTPKKKVVQQAPKPVKPKVKAKAPPKPVVVTLRTDELFGTNKWKLEDSRKIGALSRQILSLRRYKGVQVIGHADYRGSEKANQKLSELRATSVARELVKNRIPASKIRAGGLGERRPVVGEKGCKGKRGSALEKCLSPDRRVTINVVGAIK